MVNKVVGLPKCSEYVQPLRRLLLYLLHDVLQILDNLNMSRDPIESLDRRNRCRASFVHLRVAWIL